MRKLSFVVAALAACGLGSAANAADFVSSTVIAPVAPSDTFGTTGGAVNCPATGLSGYACSFTNTFTFTTPVGYTLTSASITSNYTDSQMFENIDFTSATLNGVAFALLPNGQFEFGSVGNVGLMSSGFNTIVVNGFAGTGALGANANFSGVITFAQGSAVPEPRTWAMMLVGFGAAGFSLRRRRKVATLQAA